MAEIKWDGEKVSKVVQEATIKALRTAGEAVLTDAIDNTPVLSGTLRRSGTVSVGSLPNPQTTYEAAKTVSQKNANPTPENATPEVYVSFNTPYARRQHEMLNFNHPLGGGPKYLENALKANEGKIQRYVGKKIEQALMKER